MGIFSRLFRIGRAEAHSALDNMEDPIRMTEQGIRELKANLQKANTGLVEVKGLAIRTRRNAENKQKMAADYERKAMTLLQRGQSGLLDSAEADRLASEALRKKEQNAAEAARLRVEAEKHEEMSVKLQAGVNQIKSTVASYENDLLTLKARAKAAEATRKINEQLANLDTSGTIAVLERMKAKVEEEEALAQAYGDLIAPDMSTTMSLDQQIDQALEDSAPEPSLDSLQELKKKMGII
jgi:phage shock protein A